jgi:hypothetical protein
MTILNRHSAFGGILILGLLASCAYMAQFVQSGEGNATKERAEQVPNEGDGEEDSSSSTLRVRPSAEDDIQVGVYFMPSWNVSSDPNKDIDSFWACLRGREDCAFLKDPGAWGPQGRIFNRRYPYEGPFLDKEPHPSLKGFYKRDDPEVARQQLIYMKEYGIDFFAYNWFFGRHYYYHRDFAPQSRIFYPQGWEVDKNRSGRVKVPGAEQWEDQLKVLLAENDKLPKDKKMKFALNWCDDSGENWIQWLKMGSSQNVSARINYAGEEPDRRLYLRVHDKMTLWWIKEYFNREDYLKDEKGRPVMYIYFPHDTESRASFYGITLKELLQRSDALAKKEGLPGIKFIASTSGAMTENMRRFGMPTTWRPHHKDRPWEGGTYGGRMLFQEYVERLSDMGFEGMTAYIYHDFYDQNNKSYADMRRTYRGHWKKWTDKFRDDPNFIYQPPVAMGWDRRGAGGTWPQQTGVPSEPEKDRVISNKRTFTAKLQEAKDVANANTSGQGNTVMVCCWNEYLEGNHIEPTVGHGFDYLEAIKEVFGN